jgi:hypothetical protein
MRHYFPDVAALRFEVDATDKTIPIAPNIKDKLSAHEVHAIEHGLQLSKMLNFALFDDLAPSLKSLIRIRELLREGNQPSV